MDSIIDRLLHSDEPSVRFKVMVNILSRDADSAELCGLQEEIRSSSRVRTLLSQVGPDGRIPVHPYNKWYGAHWVLATLADIGYPAGDESLLPLRDQVYGWLLSKRHERSIPTIQGRVRRCASQEGNALHYLLTLGLADARTDELARRLCRWQWPDGGWNCDRKPEATNSSFHESLIPLRALALHGRVTGDPASRRTAEWATDIFLKRGLYKRQRDGQIIHPNFVALHYPYYWRYNILYALRVMAEAGFIADPRCAAALDLLASKRLSDSGFPAEKKYYSVYGGAKTMKSGHSLVDWGGTSKVRMNEWVTVDALGVLKAAGRLG